MSSTTSRSLAGTLLNVNVPAGEPEGVEVVRLGKRIYRDELTLTDAADGRRRYWVYGRDPGFHDEPGTDLAADRGRQDRGHADPLRADARGGHRRARPSRPRAPARRPAVREVEE